MILVQTILVMTLISGVVIMVSSYGAKDNHIYNISNYALAIAFGLSSVCFSWARAEELGKADSPLCKQVEGSSLFHYYL